MTCIRVLNIDRPLEVEIYDEKVPWIIKQIYVNPDVDIIVVKKGIELLREAGADSMYWLSKYSHSSYQRYVGDEVVYFTAIYHEDGTKSLYADVKSKPTK